jgi:hypothetical protein
VFSFEHKWFAECVGEMGQSVYREHGMWQRLLGIGLVIVVFAWSGVSVLKAQQPSGPLTDQDILQMVKAGFDDSTILRYIRANDVDFDLSVPAMVALKNAGVSQSLIQAMLSIEVSKKEIGVDAALAAIAATASSPRDDVHVFALQAGRLIPMEPEVVSWKPNTGFRSVASFGFDRGPATGAIPGPHSDLMAKWPPMNMVPVDIAFYILTPRGGSASDFQLLHLSEKGDRREFRTVPSDRAHGWGIVEHTVPFTLEALAPRVYKVTLPNINVGEYGLLAPTTEVKPNSPSQGKIYTFRLVE